VKALTLWQPWASLIAIGAKRIETRSWPTSYRGPLAIHAAMRFPPAEREFAKEMAYVYNALAAEPLPLGAVVATVRLVECVSITKGMADSIADGVEVDIWNCYVVDDAEAALGDFSVGRYAWILSDLVRWTPPVSVPGARGLWDWTP